MKPKRKSMFRHVILPGTDHLLLRRELAQAFAAEGLRVSVVPPEKLRGPTGESQLPALLEDGPALLFSINFQGIEPLKPLLELLNATSSAAAVWLVDNPWNILAGVRDPRWKQLPLFVTDYYFIAPLAALGAFDAHHLPLAANFETFAPDAQHRKLFLPPPDPAPFAFAGRSAFPDKEHFFAGQSISDSLLAESTAALCKGERPDLAWWEKKLNLVGVPQWPGKAARKAAFGAEEANLVWRTACLLEIAREGADIYGDEGWRHILQSLPFNRARLFPPVDYYARLPGIYGAAQYSLCMTSLQLPHGLNQRHFDIWAAGGLALLDSSPGLFIFPQELTEPVIFKRAKDIPAIANRIAARNERADLIRDWQNCLKAEHTYGHRVRAVLEALTV